jgi:membrane-associated phospholipid phosphatase
MSLEMQILNGIQTLRCSFLDILMPLLSNGLILWFLLAAVLILRKATRRAGLIIAAAILMEIFLCNVVMKNVFHRIRPCDIDTTVPLLVNRPTDYSFPSGHTALSFAATTGLWLSGTLKRWRIPALILACLIAFSRLYLYLHYPTDILMGIAIGVFCGWASNKLLQTYAKKKQLREAAA